VRNQEPSGRAAYVYRPFGAFRLLLASLVMVQHFGADLAPEGLRSILAPYYMGDMAVLVFFALSGFVILEAIDCIYRNRPKAFMENRFLRIAPHFVLAVALSMLAHFAFRALDGAVLWRSQASFPIDAFEMKNVILNFIGIIPLADRFISYNFLDIAWAVRIEVAFYLVMAVCLILQARIMPKKGVGLIAGLMVIPFALAFGLAMTGRGIGMFSYVPYFVFGAAWYYWLRGCAIALPVALVTVPIMIWHCAGQVEKHAADVALPALVWSNLVLFAALLALMCILSFGKGGRWTSLDQRLGALTYPLYLYHEVVFVGVMTFSAGYSYLTLAASIILSLALSAVMVALVDKPINRFRDRIRGRTTTFALRPELLPSERTREA
jgi:peptidoglycan/LPS O-acetylase OafA/YrhL